MNDNTLLSQIEEFYKFKPCACNKLVYQDERWVAIHHPYGCEMEDEIAEGEDLAKVLEQFKRDYPREDED